MDAERAKRSARREDRRRMPKRGASQVCDLNGKFCFAVVASRSARQRFKNNRTFYGSFDWLDHEFQIVENRSFYLIQKFFHRKIAKIIQFHSESRFQGSFG